MPRVRGSVSGGSWTSSVESAAVVTSRDWSVYVHVPFCEVRCPYCHFACFVNQDPDFPLRYVRAVERELDFHSGRLDSARIVSLYFGGGTPTALSAPARKELCRWLGEELRPRFAPEAEFTLEANPESLDPRVLDDWLEAGLNRLSIGIQTMHPKVLEFLGRRSTPASNLRALDLACQRVDNVSADLIVASPLDDWTGLLRSIDAITSHPVSHISAYLLEIHADTRFGREVAQGLWQPSPNDQQADLYLRLVQELADRGFHAYELSNFAQPGRESRHNGRYWTRDPYLGLGPSAHSFDGAHRWWNHRDAHRWCESVEAGTLPVEGREHLDRRAVRRERILLGLRRDEGIPEAWVEDRSRLVDDYLRAGLLERVGPRLRATPEGWLLLDEVVLRLCD